MIIAFRVDASNQIGTGHVIRCLTLADRLRERGAHSIFICRPHIGHLISLIKKRGHQVLTLSPPDPRHIDWLGSSWESDALQTRGVLGKQPLDWLVIDHYALDRRWEEVMRPCTRRILVIDDLANRPHDCDILLDQNLGRQAEHYGHLLKHNTQTLIGPEFALLKPEFFQLREYSLQRRKNPQLKNLLITMGGVDQLNATSLVLNALKNCKLPVDLSITVVMGPSAAWLTQVQNQVTCMQWPTHVLVGVDNMAHLMANSDLCIGAAGSTCWERCCLGLPSIQLVVAENQKEAAHALANMHAVLDINLSSHFCTQFKILIESIDLECMKTLAKNSANVCNGHGLEMVVASIITR